MKQFYYCQLLLEILILFHMSDHMLSRHALLLGGKCVQRRYILPKTVSNSKGAHRDDTINKIIHGEKSASRQTVVPKIKWNTDTKVHKLQSQKIYVEGTQWCYQWCWHCCIVAILFNGQHWSKTWMCNGLNTLRQKHYKIEHWISDSHWCSKEQGTVRVQ